MNLFFSRKERTLFPRLVADRDHVVKRFPLELRYAFRTMSSKRDSDFSHHPSNVGIDSSWRYSRAFSPELVSAQLVQESLCHLGTRGVVGAKKQNRLQMGHH